MRPTRLLFALVIAFGCAAAAPAKTLRLASAFDPQTMDPHALALLYHTRVITQVYENLVGRDKNFRLEPQLASSWESLDGGRRWRFKLRPGVKFHDGSPLTADDVVFSLERSAAAPSQRNFHLRNMTGARRVDDLTVDVLLNAPDAVLPEKTWLIAIMSKAWATRHNVLKAQDYNGKQETHAVRNVNGTGPYKLQRYEPDARTILVANRDWWGTKQAGLPAAGKAVTEVHYVVMFSDATRLAALASGEVDLVLDPPFQDVARLKQDKRVKVSEVTDLGMQYIGFDQWRAELEGSDTNSSNNSSNTRGRNPFKDVRVRRADVSRDRHRPDPAEGAARAGQGHRRVHVESGRRLRSQARAAPQVRPARGACVAQGGGLCRRLRGHDGLRQHRLPRSGLPGRRGNAHAGRHSRAA